MSRAGSVKGTLGSEGSENEMLLPCPDSKRKPLPLITSQMSAENGHVKNGMNKQKGSFPERNERPEEDTEREASVPAAPPLPDYRTDPKADESFSMLTLQRSKPANMKEKVEKWRERRSDILVSDRIHYEKKNNLK